VISLTQYSGTILYAEEAQIIVDKDVIDRVFEALESGDVDQRRRVGKALETGKLRVRLKGHGGRGSP
jgi:hypothetical protein